MFALAAMVMVSAILGTFALALMFDPKVINTHFNEYVSNGTYMAFDRLGEYYHVGGLFMKIYAWCNVIGQFSTLVLSIDAPLRMLLVAVKQNFMFQCTKQQIATNGMV